MDVFQMMTMVGNVRQTDSIMYSENYDYLTLGLDEYVVIGPDEYLVI